MNVGEAFFDTNVVLYLLASDELKADRAEELISAGGVISVQVLNEAAHVMRRKLSMRWTEVNQVLSRIATICLVKPLTMETHLRGKQIAERYGLSIYDSMICAAAVLADCPVLYTEDLQDGLLIAKTLTLRNPFRIGK